MKARRFKRNKSNGFLSAMNGLKYLYGKGPCIAKNPNHHTIVDLVKKGYVIRVGGSWLDISDSGIRYIEGLFPDLERWVEPEKEEEK
jgi:hypothetical protein